MAVMRSTRLALGLSATLLAAACGSAGLDGMAGAGPDARTGVGGPSAALAMAQSHGQIVPAAARLAVATVLPRAGWTATASDFQGGNEASNVLDGDGRTIWHSQWSPTVNLPHSITLDLGAATAVSGLLYLPRQDGGVNGTIGRYEVAVSADGTTFGTPEATGTWVDDQTQKSVSFPTVTARFVRLTGLTEAGGRGPWTSVAELNLLGESTSTPPTGTKLPRAGWTATASDTQGGTDPEPAVNVLDGNPASIWHSQYNPSVGLPHSLTINLGTPTQVSGLTYTPRGDGGINGRIGSFQVALSDDGVTFGAPVATGTWADDATDKVVGFPAASARYVRLTALTEAGNRGPWTSVGELNLLGTPTGGTGNGAAGSWGPVIGFPIVPVSAVLLPGNKVLTFSAFTSTNFSMGGKLQTQTAILDLATGAVSQRLITNTGHEMFCSGIAVLPDGRVLVAGGSDSGATSIYSPVTDTWAKGPVMNIPRAYQSDVTLSTGQVFTLGGSWNGGTGGKNGEVYTPDGTWRLVPNVLGSSILTSNDPEGVYREDNHAWLFATANGGVFQAGPAQAMHWFTTAGSGTTAAAGTRADDTDAMNGNAVLYDVGKIFTDGGATAYKNVDATANAFTIDITGGPTRPVTVTRRTSMSFTRAFQNSVVLPDGKVLVIGGQAHPVPFSDDGSVMTPELWDPATARFTLMAPQASPRNYHSVALLLPDGRVFSGGGGLCGDGCATNHPDGQIFTPPYLLNADGSLRTRPTITAAPTSAHPATTITVGTGGAVSSVVIVRTGGGTHTVDTDQRRIPLAFTNAAGTSHQVTIPASTGTVVPGNYLLFVLDAAGTPSVSRMVNIR